MPPDIEATYSERVIVIAPTVRDGEVTRRLLAAEGIDSIAERGNAGVAAEFRRGIGALLLTDISLADGRAAEALRAVEQQPEWSSVPVLVLCRNGTLKPQSAIAIRHLRNFTILDRPSSTRALVSAIHAALRGRRWQYEIRDQILKLRDAETALRSADRRKDEFLATLAHELRNPLAPIRTGVLLLEGVRSDAVQFTRVRQMMERQLVQIVRLIDELLDVSRIATGKIVLQNERLDLREIITTAIESCQPALDFAHHQLVYEKPDGAVVVSGDRTRLAQSFSNIIQNAAKYTPDGGRIQVVMGVAGEWVSVAIKDSGFGIPPEMLAKVFDLFAQVNRTLDRAQGGLGIGLSLVRSLIGLHGGTVEAASEGVGRGSEFTITLPLAGAPAPSEAVVRAPEPGGPSRPLRVLIVDDNKDAADSLSLLAESLGHETRVAYGGDAALETAVEFGPQVIFCDLGMPQVNGIEFAGRLRQRRNGTEAPLLVAVTGWGGDGDRKRTRLAGFAAHLTKPVSFESIQRVLRMA